MGLLLGHQDTFLLIRSSRRTLALEIKPDATIVVRAPRRVPLKEIHRFVAGHDDWISRKRAEVLARPRSAAKEFTDGENFLLLGQSCGLCLIDNASLDVDFDGRLLLSAQAQPYARDAIVAWYKHRARQEFRQRTEIHAAAMGYHPSGIRITSPLRRWGSCGITDCLNFNWRLVMAPPEIIDYVVVHELAHIHYKSHGADFWGLVAKFYPNHRKARRWLKDNGHLLEI
jgi:predicted metal-dependent hydrolase